MHQNLFCYLGVDAVTMRRDMPLCIPAVGLNQMRTRPAHQVHRSVEAGGHCESASKFGVVPSHFIVRSFLSMRDAHTLSPRPVSACVLQIVHLLIERCAVQSGVPRWPLYALLPARRQGDHSLAFSTTYRIIYDPDSNGRLIKSARRIDIKRCKAEGSRWRK